MNVDLKTLIKKTKEFEEKSPQRSMMLLFSSLLLLLFSYFISLFVPSVIIKFISSLFHGLLIVRLFGMYHDYAHGAILNNNFLAKIIFKVFGLYVLTPISVWRRSHNFHHAHNSKLAFSSIGSFPIMSKKQFESATKLEKSIYLFSRHPITIFFGCSYILNPCRK